ncbi:MAG: hypothetical protein WKG07_15305 [Hymenobacter sp.]
MTQLPALLARHQAAFAPVLPTIPGRPGVARLDFTAANPRLTHPERLRDTAAFDYLGARDACGAARPRRHRRLPGKPRYLPPQPAL